MTQRDYFKIPTFDNILNSFRQARGRCCYVSLKALFTFSFQKVMITNAKKANFCIMTVETSVLSKTSTTYVLQVDITCENKGMKLNGGYFKISARLMTFQNHMTTAVRRGSEELVSLVTIHSRFSYFNFDGVSHFPPEPTVHTS